MTEEYSRMPKGHVNYLKKLPERLGISEEDIIKIIGVDKEKYSSLMDLNFWPTKTKEKVVRLLAIDMRLGALFGEGYSKGKDASQDIGDFLKSEQKLLDGKSPLELMTESSEGLFRVQNCVWELCDGVYL